MKSLANIAAIPSTEWQRRGRCRSVDSQVFFPPHEPEPRLEREAREAQAKAICAGCVVRADCLSWALQIREPHGVWGGASEGERRALLQARGVRVR